MSVSFAGLFFQLAVLQPDDENYQHFEGVQEPEDHRGRVERLDDLVDEEQHQKP